MPGIRIFVRRFVSTRCGHQGHLAPQRYSLIHGGRNRPRRVARSAGVTAIENHGHACSGRAIGERDEVIHRDTIRLRRLEVLTDELWSERGYSPVSSEKE